MSAFENLAECQMFCLHSHLKVVPTSSTIILISWLTASCLQDEGEAVQMAQQSTVSLCVRKMLLQTLRHISGGSVLPAWAAQPLVLQFVPVWL